MLASLLILQSGSFALPRADAADRYTLLKYSGVIELAAEYVEKDSKGEVYLRVSVNTKIPFTLTLDRPLGDYGLGSNTVRVGMSYSGDYWFRDYKSYSASCKERGPISGTFTFVLREYSLARFESDSTELSTDLVDWVEPVTTPGCIQWTGKSVLRDALGSCLGIYSTSAFFPQCRIYNILGSTTPLKGANIPQISPGISYSGTAALTLVEFKKYEPFDFSITVTPPEIKIITGQPAKYTVKVSPLKGEVQPVTLSAIKRAADAYSGLVELTPQRGTPPFESQFTIPTTEATKPGRYTLEIRGDSGTLTRFGNVVALLVEEEKFDFEIKVNPASLTVGRGTRNDDYYYDVNVQLLSIVKKPVKLNVESTDTNLKLGAIEFSVATGTPPFASRLPIAVLPETRPGEYSFTFVGEGGGVTKKATMKLVVKEPEMGVRGIEFLETAEGFGGQCVFEKTLADGSMIRVCGNRQDLEKRPELREVKLDKNYYGPYEDSGGHCTVGIGHKIHDGSCTASDLQTEEGRIRERDKSVELKMKDIAIRQALVAERVKVPLTQKQFDALVSFTFNSGPEGLQELLRLSGLNDLGYEKVPDLMRVLRTTAKNKVLAGLVNRRNGEANMFASDLSGEGSQQVAKVIKEQVRPSQKDVVDLYIMTTSQVSDFKFDDTMRTISFKVSGTDGSKGITAIPINAVLKNQHKVWLDGKEYTEYMIGEDMETKDPIIILSYRHSTREIVITGAEVVPEYPNVILIMLLGLGLMVVVSIHRHSRST